MSFRELYAFVQDLETPVDLSRIRQKIGEMIPGRSCRVIRATLDVDRLLGYYISARNEDTAFFGHFPGKAVVVVARDLNLCWSRYVELKEVMHLFDDPLASTNTAEELEVLLAGMCENVGPSRSPQIQSEYGCMWMALALCCPETTRADLQQRREAGMMTDLDVAQLLKIPERFIPVLLSHSYKENVAYLLRDE